MIIAWLLVAFLALGGPCTSFDFSQPLPAKTEGRMRLLAHLDVQAMEDVMRAHPELIACYVSQRFCALDEASMEAIHEAALRAVYRQCYDAQQVQRGRMPRFCEIRCEVS